MGQKSLKHIPEIDGLRALAILLVIVWHYGNNLLQGSSWSWAKYVVILTNQTWSGVDLFFVLSGFLITGILIKNKGSKNYFKTFYIRRFFRIFPIYYVVVLLFLLVKAVQLPIGSYLLENDSIPMWTYFLHIQNFFMAQQNSFGSHFLGVSWSLAIEEQFYILLPLAVFLLNRSILKYALPLAILVGTIFRTQTSGYSELLLLPARIDGLMVGATIAYFYRFHRDALTHLKAPLLWAVLLATIGLAVGFKILNVDIPGGNILLISLAYGILLLLALQEKMSGFKKMLRYAFLSKISQVSYGIYLYHVIVLGLVFNLATKRTPGLQSWTDFVWVGLAAILTYLLAKLSFKYIEKPLIRKGHKYEY